MKSPEQNIVPQKFAVGGGVRALSAVGANRQQEMAKLQMQETNDPFFASRNKEEAEKQRQLEKKKEYAAELQLQMQMKKAEQQKAQELRQKVSIPPDQRPPIHQNVAFDQYKPPKPVQEYQHPQQDHQYNYGVPYISDQMSYNVMPG